MATFNDLPNEMLMKIFSFLDIIERQRLETVCKRWQLNIKQMFEIKKLKFVHVKSGDQTSRGSFVINNSTLLVITKRISDLAHILRKFNGNLRKFYLVLNARRVIIPQEVCKLIKQNKYLESVGIEGAFGEPTRILHYVSIDNVRAFNLNVCHGRGVKGCNVELSFLNMMNSDKMEFFACINPPRYILERIYRVFTLKSLFIRDSAGFSRFLYGQLSNLEVLSICDSYEEDKKFWRNISVTAPNLRVIECNDFMSMSHAALAAISSLPNLRSVRLRSPINSMVLEYFSNLEEIYCTATHYPAEIIHNFLQRSPNLKKCYFEDASDYRSMGNITDRVNQRFQKIAMEFGSSVVISRPESLLDIEWAKYF